MITSIAAQELRSHALITNQELDRIVADKLMKATLQTGIDDFNANPIKGTTSCCMNRETCWEAGRMGIGKACPVLSWGTMTMPSRCQSSQWAASCTTEQRCIPSASSHRHAAVGGVGAGGS